MRSEITEVAKNVIAMILMSAVVIAMVWGGWQIIRLNDRVDKLERIVKRPVKIRVYGD